MSKFLKRCFLSRKGVLCFLLVFLWNSLVFSQTLKISGRIVSRDNEEPIAGAWIAAVGSAKTVVTNDKGEFYLVINKIPPVKLKINAFGYKSQDTLLTKANKMITIALSEQYQVLGNDIVVSASRIPERILESPVSIERLSIDDIKKTASTSFYESLVNLKGVEQSTQSITFTSLNTRGFNANGNVRFNQFIDGMDNQAPGLNFSVGNIVGISDLDLESVELLPGSSSALYGAGGINGTLLLNSKNPFKYQGLSMQFKTGINHLDSRQQPLTDWNDMQFRYAKSFKDRWAFKVNVSYIKADDWRARDYSNYDRVNMKYKEGNRITDPAYDGINSYGDEIKANMQTVAQAVVQTGRNTYISQYQNATGTLPSESQITNFLSTNSNISPFFLGLQGGLIPDQDVSRTGYIEEDLLDYRSESLRTSGSLHYKIRPNMEAIAQAYWGTGNSAYTGADRYGLANFRLGQYKLELKGDKFFLRAYTTQERSGDAYNATALASFMNERFKPSTAWFPQYIGAYLKAKNMGVDEETAHNTARSVTDEGRFMPGSEVFETAKQDITSRTIGAEGGAKFKDKTNLWHYEGMYNFSDWIPEIDLIAGGSYRLYALNSGGTIFDDLHKKLSIYEYGAYLQASRKFLDAKLKATASVRYDKNQNFKGSFSPRLAGVWNFTQKHYLRLSYQTGFRNPTAQAQYLDLLVRAGSRLIGALPDILDKYQLQANKPYTDESYRTYVATGYSDPSVLETFSFNSFKPERVQAYEIGYRASLTPKLFIDANYYISNYKDFLTGAVVWQNPTPQDLNGLTTPTRYEVSVNSTEDVRTQGWALGIDYSLGKFKFISNVSHDQLSQFPEQFFNTYNSPAYRFNLGVGSTEIFKNTSFNIVYRWQEEFMWRSIFGVGEVAAFGTLDGQVSFKLPIYQSVLKIGASNILNKYYITSPGNPAIGGMYYVSLSFDSSILYK